MLPVQTQRDKGIYQSIAYQSRGARYTRYDEPQSIRLRNLGRVFKIKRLKNDFTILLFSKGLVRMAKSDTVLK